MKNVHSTFHGRRTKKMVNADGISEIMKRISSALFLLLSIQQPVSVVFVLCSLKIDSRMACIKRRSGRNFQRTRKAIAWESLVSFCRNTMEPLATNRRYLIWLRACPPDESTSRWQKLAHFAFSAIVLLGILSIIAACLTYCWKFVSIDLGRSVFAFMVAVVHFSVVYMALVGMILLRHKIGTIFDNLSAIYKTSK